MAPSTAPLQVLTDADLFQRIASFQSGIPWPLYEFWLQHKPVDEPVIDGFRESSGLVEKIVQLGEYRLLELAKQATLPFKESFFGGGEFPKLELFSVALHAITYHNAEMLQWGITNGLKSQQGQCIPLVDLWKRVITQFRDGDTALLDVLKPHVPVPTSRWDQNIVFSSNELISAYFTNMELLDWLVTEQPVPNLERDLLQHAAIVGDLAVFTYFHERRNSGRYEPHVFSYAYDRNAPQFDKLAYLLEHDLVDVDEFTAIDMLECHDEPTQQFVARFASHFQPAFETLVRRYADERDSVLALALLDRKSSCFDVTNIKISIDRATASGCLEHIKTLHERGIATATTAALDNAAGNERWDVMRFLLKHRSEGFSTRAIDEAAQYCDMTMLRFLIEHSNAGCTTDALDAAAKNGHLHVVKFLHTTRSEGCTVAAMDKAAGNGHLDVVQYLHEHRAEGCTADAVEGAVRGRHQAVVDFLRMHYPHLFGPQLLHDALLYGVFDLFLELQTEFPEEADAVVESVAFKAGEKMELRTIHFIITVLKRTDVAHRIMDGAAHTVCPPRSGQEQWLRAVFAITGPQSCRLSAAQAAAAQLVNGFAMDQSLRTMRFVIRACGDDGERARAVFIEAARTRQRRFLVDALMAEVPTDEPRPLHPFLTDPRTPTWAVHEAFDGLKWSSDLHRGLRGLIPLAVTAIYNRDLTVLEMLRDTPASARPRQDLAGRDLDPSDVDRHFSFTGSRQAAVRTGNLPMLQWLFREIDWPVEPTLLSESVYYHKFEIAEWLVSNHPEACLETNWNAMVYLPWLSECGLGNGLLEWLELRDSIRACLDFRPLIDAAASGNDSESLRTLHKWYPELVMARPYLLKLANKRVGEDDEEPKAIHVLQEIGYEETIQCY